MATDSFTAMALAVCHPSPLLYSFFVLGIQDLQHIMNDPRGNLTLLILNIKEASELVYETNHVQPQNCLVILLFFQQPPQLFHRMVFDGTTPRQPIARKYHFSVLLIEGWSSVISVELDTW